MRRAAPVVQPARAKPKRPLRIFIAPGLLFLFGLLVALYPLITQLYYATEASEQVTNFKEGRSALAQEAIDERIDLARAYNETLDPKRMSDPYTRRESQGIAEYARMLEVRELIGHVEIPKIRQDLPIYAGTSDEVLNKGVGHLEGTSLPTGGINTHSVLTAHRGLPTARLFTDLDKLELGDIFYVHNIDKVLAYEVDQIIVVEPNEFEHALVVPGQDHVTLLTCTPYMINSHRLLVRGIRVEMVETSPEEGGLPVTPAVLGPVIPLELVIPAALGGVLLIASVITIRRRVKHGKEPRRAA
ncbi:MAG: class C sortase [Propionibacteriaceae bacterium]|nr:class C sortase [Propionibacteriaceae bacterium]